MESRPKENIDGSALEQGSMASSYTASAAIDNSEQQPPREPQQAQSEPKELSSIDWDSDPRNALNWPAWKKAIQVAMLSSLALQTSLATSVIAPARDELAQEFNVSGTVAILPLTLYTVAVGFGPVLGGPLSETVGRYPVYLWNLILGALFTLGAGFTHSFAGLCVLRFLAGFCWGPSLAVAPGSFADTFKPKTRGAVSAIFILMPFLGPGLGPIIGSFVVNRKGWRWTQWTLLFFTIFSLVLVLLGEETFPAVIKKRIAKKRGEPIPPGPPLSARLKAFAVIALVRPLRMLVSEPIVAFICLYVAAEFGTLFSFFAAVPFTFGVVYHFGIEQSGLVFVALIIGCVLGLLTILLCDVLVYRKKVVQYAPRLVPPEYRLYPAIIGCSGLPIGLFWFAWTARESISWASPAAAIIPFAWGNLCLFVSTIQYTTDTYHGTVVASASGANSVARYSFAAVFPLFTIQMYEKLGIDWASSLLGFVALVLLPIPWILFKFGPKIRAMSKYETVKSG